MRRATAAERARTLAYGIAGGVIVPAGQEQDTAVGPPAPVAAHVTGPAGRPLLLVPAASPVAAALRDEPDLPATLRICDVAPVPLADRLRGRAWLHGRLTALDDREEAEDAALRLWHLHSRPEALEIRDARGGAWTVLALEVAEVEVSDAWGHAVVEPEEYRAALPDPFVVIEHGMLTHLDRCHRAELAWLFQERFGPIDGEPVVRPLALDRHGLWLRCLLRDADGFESFDLYVEFPAPVRDLHGLRRVCRRLLAPAAQ